MTAIFCSIRLFISGSGRNERMNWICERAIWHSVIHVAYTSVCWRRTAIFQRFTSWKLGRGFSTSKGKTVFGLDCLAARRSPSIVCVNSPRVPLKAKAKHSGSIFSPPFTIKVSCKVFLAFRSLRFFRVVFGWVAKYPFLEFSAFEKPWSEGWEFTFATRLHSLRLTWNKVLRWWCWFNIT